MVNTYKFLFAGLIVLIFDRLTKYIIANTLDNGTSIPVIQAVFHVTYTTNTGAAFGILPGSTIVFLVANLIVLTLIYTHWKELMHAPLLAISTGMIAAGGISNLLDRLIYGAVIDFIDFRMWPVFNIADSALTIGTLLFIITLFKKNTRKTVRKHRV